MEQDKEKMLQEITVLAQKKYPGRSLQQLSPEEKDALFKDYKTQRALGASLANTPTPKGKEISVGKYGSMYVAPTWSEQLASGLQRGVGLGMMAKSAKDAKTARKAAADVSTREGAIGADLEESQSAREEEERRAWLERILSATY